jgi:hypothetical protein
MISKRLAALESKLVRPPDKPPTRSPGPRLCVAIVAGLNRRRRKNESVLAAYSRALGLSVVKLWMLVSRKPDRWWAKHLAVDSCPYSMDEMRDAIVREFVADEMAHRLIEACIAEAGGAGGWLANMMGPRPWPGLTKVRPLRPPCTENPSDICESSG